MSGDPLFIIVAIAILAVFVVLMLGLGAFTKGGETAFKYSNKLMRWRIIMQAIAVALILIFVALRGGGN